jgi:hypothetical protein
MASSDLTQDYLREILHYDPATGLFTWLKALSYRGKVGSIAGCVNKRLNRRHIGIHGREYYAYRLAWFYVKGSWPAEDLDHKDGDSTNDRFDNLRPCNMSQNQQNLRRARTFRSGALLGAWPTPAGRWFSMITVKKRKIYLGNFATDVEAHTAYLTAKRRLHEFNQL